MIDSSKWTGGTSPLWPRLVALWWTIVDGFFFTPCPVCEGHGRVDTVYGGDPMCMGCNGAGTYHAYRNARQSQ